MYIVNEREVGSENHEGYAFKVLVNNKLGCQTMKIYTATLCPEGRRDFCPTGEEVIYILNGYGKVICEGEVFPLSAGNVIYCPKGLRVIIENTGQEELMVVEGISVEGYKCSSTTLAVRHEKSIEQKKLDVRSFKILSNGEGITVLLVEFPGNYHGNEDIHDSGEEILYVFKGRGEVCIEGVAEEISSGAAIFIPARVKHYLVNKESAPMNLLVFLTPARKL